MKKIYIFYTSKYPYQRCEVEASTILEAREKVMAKHPSAKFSTIQLKP